MNEIYIYRMTVYLQLNIILKCFMSLKTKTILIGNVTFLEFNLSQFVKTRREINYSYLKTCVSCLHINFSIP